MELSQTPRPRTGTNFASAAMSGLKIVQIKCGVDGYVDLAHLREQVALFLYFFSSLFSLLPSLLLFSPLSLSLSCPC